MMAYALNTFKTDILPASSGSQIERRPRPLLANDPQKMPRVSARNAGLKRAVIHEVRELLHQAALALAIAESKASDNSELLDFLKGGERALAEVGILMTAHFPSR
jgi:hypothetical protein